MDRYKLIIFTESGKVGGTFKENERLKKEVKKLEEENNLLKIKFELLLDMVINRAIYKRIYKIYNIKSFICPYIYK
jgi:cell division protein FtsB